MTNKKQTTAHQEIERWLAARKEAALHIDPETAEVEWWYALTLDPYGVLPELPEECRQVGREYFARSPGGDVWVEFGDLPETTKDALWKKHRSKLAFPAGLVGVCAKRIPRDQTEIGQTKNGANMQNRIG
jgi:hypothetical protein